jgi:hypothetical protein
MNPSHKSIWNNLVGMASCQKGNFYDEMEEYAIWSITSMTICSEPPLPKVSPSLLLSSNSNDWYHLASSFLLLMIFSSCFMTWFHWEVQGILICNVL